MKTTQKTKFLTISLIILCICALAFCLSMTPRLVRTASAEETAEKAILFNASSRSTVTTGDFTVTGDGIVGSNDSEIPSVNGGTDFHYDESDNILRILSNKSMNISTPSKTASDPTVGCIFVMSDITNGANLTFNGAHVKHTGATFNDAALQIFSASNITLIGENSFEAGEEGIVSTESLTFEGTGSLTTIGGVDGIYGHNDITIQGGATVKSSSPSTDDGISGIRATGNLKISGDATVIATGGSGIYSKNGSITIEDNAIVTATSTSSDFMSSALGSRGDITISGGVVTAISTGGASENFGMVSGAGAVNIIAGTVTARAADMAIMASTEIVVPDTHSISGSADADADLADLVLAEVSEEGWKIVLSSDGTEAKVVCIKLHVCSGGTATCTAKAECEGCYKEYGELNPANHSGTATEIVANNNGTHDVKYTCCQVVENDDVACSGGTATCEVKAQCTICNAEYGEKNASNHAKDTFVYVDNNDGTHTKKNECCCAVVDDDEAHTYVSSTCVCGAEKSAVTPDNPDEPEKDGLGGGAIAGIAVGSVATAGLGGFALVWFVIKKKSWADLLAIFKKK